MPFFPPRLVNGHRASPRVSTELSPLDDTHTDSSPSDQALALVRRIPQAQNTASEELALVSGPSEEDFEEITYDELRLSLCPADPAHFAPVFDYQRAYNRSLLSRSRSSLSRLRKLSQLSLRKSREVLARSRLREATIPEEDYSDEDPFALAPHRPPSDFSSSASSSPETPPLPILIEARPFREFQDRSPEIRTQEVTEPDKFAAVATSRLGRARSLTSSLKRLRTLSKPSLFSSARKHAPQVFQVPPTESSRTPARPSIDSVAAEDRRLPELLFDPVDFSVVFDDDQQSLAVVDTPLLDDSLPLPSIEVVNATPRLQPIGLQLRLPGYEFVDPRSLTVSTPASAVEGISLFGSPAPSPSWFSRNVLNIEPQVIERTATLVANSPPPLVIPPPPSPPLYIIPRSLRPDTYYLRGPEVEYEFTTAPQTPQSTTSSLTLYNPSQRGSFLGPRSVGSRPTSINRLSVIYRRSIADNRQSIHSIVTYNEERDSRDIIRNTALNVFLLSGESPDHQPSSLTPLALEAPLSSFPNSITHSNSHLAEEDSPYAIFTPSPKAHEYSEAVNFQPPPYLVSFVKQVLRSTMDMYKQADTVDWGGEVDYSGYEWFKDPPPRPEPQPQPTTDNYVPQPGVIEQNETFDFALRSAPNVLYARFKQFGQLGVLAWCSEFSELIDALKQLGFEGNMFVSTRTQALKSCEDILRLKLDIEMQIIVMYLSSQIARLRRFLDSDRQWDDYPKPSFPLDYTEYARER